MASIKSTFQALKFFLVFTRQISGLREGCQSWAYTSEASSCCTIDYKRVQIPYKNIFTLFIYPLFTTNGVLTTNKHNMKIFVLAFSSPCWHLPIGTGHGKQMSLLNPKCTVLSLASRETQTLLKCGNFSSTLNLDMADGALDLGNKVISLLLLFFGSPFTLCLAWPLLIFRFFFVSFFPSLILYFFLLSLLSPSHATFCLSLSFFLLQLFNFVIVAVVCYCLVTKW